MMSKKSRTILFGCIAIGCVTLIVTSVLTQSKGRIHFPNRNYLVGLRTPDYVSSNIEQFDAFRAFVSTSSVVQEEGRITIISSSQTGMVTETYPSSSEWQKSLEYRDLLLRMGNLNIGALNYTQSPECLVFSLVGREGDVVVYNPTILPETTDNYTEHIYGNWWCMFHPYQ